MAEELHTIVNRTDESFDASESLKYDLIFELGEKSFGFSILDTEKNRFAAIGFFRNHLTDVIPHLPQLGCTYRSVKGIISNSRFTLIPEALYLEEEKEKYFSFLHDREAGDAVYSDQLEHLEIRSVYSIPGRLKREVDHVFPKVTVFHISTVLIRNLWMNAKNITSQKVFLNMRDSQFDVLVFDGRQLIYCNSFHFMTPEDIAYYLIFVFEQLNLNPEETGLTLLGSVERYSPVYDLLFRYIRNMEFAGRNEAYGYSYLFNEIPDHFYYSLLNPVS
jgi:hypothetical protein